MGHGKAISMLTYYDGMWHKGNPKIIGPHSHGMWLGSTVFDGARAIAGKTPDLDRHCQRLIHSARLMGLSPMLTAHEIEDLALDGVSRFAKNAELYICPLFYAEDGFVHPDPDSTRFALTINVSPLPEPKGFTAGRSSFRRPARDAAPTEAKASCLYPNISRACREAAMRGFENAVVLDPNGNVAEFAYANLFMVKDGVVHTPAPNGTFLNGITRQRVIALLRSARIEVVERAVIFEELLNADELFSTGNYAKVTPCIRLENHEFPIGPVYTKARQLYWDFMSK
jgi:branched-chain amino acid aminotransferase